MTREEAITLIKPLMLMMKNPQGEVISDAYYALDMAIQALAIIDKIEPMFGDMLDIPTQEPSGEGE